MSDILQKILATKRQEVDAAKAACSYAALQSLAASAPPVRDFVGAIRSKHALGQPAIIAEIKKASPSAGVFRAGLEGANAAFEPAKFAQSYEKHGAACLSVLTDRDYFQGCTADLIAARGACHLPVLRKDFIIDAYQILEARAMGADAVLFIMGAVAIELFREWEDLAISLGLAVLAESHSAAELKQALTLKTPLMGVNNRDLTRFVIDIQTTISLKPHIPSDRILITESGISSSETVFMMTKAGVNTYLIGGSLMVNENPGRGLDELFGDRLRS